MPHPHVSLVIPAYNREDYLPTTLESALAQTCRDMEIIVSDNASTDGTVAIVEAAMKRDPRVRLVRQPTNVGMAGNYRACLQEAKGDYIYFLDSDDILFPTAIEKMAAMLDQRQDINITCTRWIVIDGEGRRVETIGLLPEGNLLREYALGYAIWTGSMMFRREVYARYGGYPGDLNNCDDWDLMLRMMPDGQKVGPVQEILIQRRIHTGNASGSVANIDIGGRKVLGRFYSRPDLPPEIAALKPQSYSVLHITTCLRSYGHGGWQEGQRYFREWLALQPIAEDFMPNLLKHIRIELWNSRANNPETLVDALFTHLPTGAERLRPFEGQLRRDAAWRAALMSYALDDAATARENLARKIEADPSLAQHPDQFREALIQVAMATSDAPAEFAKHVRKHLPQNAQALTGVVADALGSLDITRAFEDYAAQRWSRVPRHVLSAMRHKPDVMRNKGVWTIFARSVLASARGGQSS